MRLVRTLVRADVMLVEDEHGTLEAMAEYLRSSRLSLIALSNGEAARSLILSHGRAFRVLATGIDLKCSVSGWDLGRAARSVQATIPVLYLMASPRQDWLRNGVAGSQVLAKPFPLSALAERVTAMSYRQRLSRIQIVE